MWIVRVKGNSLDCGRRILTFPAAARLGLLVFLLTFGGTQALGEPSGVESETCLACHEGYAAGISSTGHVLNGLAGVSCVSCHTGAEVHVDDPSRSNIGNPAHMVGPEARQACQECHQPHLQLDNFGYDPHNEHQVNCAACHRVHGSNRSLLVSRDADFCITCHAPVKAAFARRSQHPVGQRNVTCLDCHRFARQSDRPGRYEQTRVCQDCHPDQAGPFPYEHSGANAYMVEGGGCLECHEAHGSENDRLLRQPGQGLCLQCHVTPVGHLNLPALHGPVRNIQDCTACHSEIHGSFVSSRFLNPGLQSHLGSNQPCSDCHELTR